MIINARGAMTVLRFELVRSITAARVAVWLVLALFPPAIVWLMLMGDLQVGDPLQFGLPLLWLIPQVMCMLGLLLWATPIVHNELEGKTWIYLAVRPGGKTAMLLGKYLTAVLWTATACWISLTLVVQIAVRNGVTDEPIRLWAVYAALTAFSSLGYGALFVLIGTLLHRRAMVVAVAYSVIVEFTVTLIPAVINKLTFAYHLRCLLLSWMEWTVPPDARPLFFGDEPAWQHLLLLAGITLALLVAAGVVLHNRQYISQTEDAT